MKILVLNCGSSSIKYQFIDTDEKITLAKGQVERIGMSSAVLTHQPHGKEKIRIVGEILDHTIAIEYVVAVLLSPNHGVIKDKKEIDAVGHRVVHGGETFSGSVLITDQVMNALKENIELAPLHNPPAAEVIKIAIEKFPQTKQFAAFDTAYFKNLPEFVKTYPIDREIAEKYSIIKYGFHGFSHQEMALQFDPHKNKKIVTVHLGAGCSASAISSGKPIDTSMGFTPIEGLPMQTRSGDLDPEIVLYLVEKIGIKKTKELIEYRSGLAGISGESGDMLELLESNDKYSRLAIEIFCYRIKKYIGAYAAALGGIDTVVFSGEIGYGSEFIRKKITFGLKYLNFKTEKLKPNEELTIAKKINK